MTSTITKPIHDPLYDCTKMAVGNDGDTLARSSITYSAQTNGSASLTDPLNSASAVKTTLFALGASTTSPFRFNTMGLRLKMLFHKLGDPTTSAPAAATSAVNNLADAMPFNSPSWNLVGSLINQIKLSINDTEVYSCTPTYFLQEFTARLIRNHTYDSLESSDHMLFTPCFDRDYTAASQAGNAAVEPTTAGTHTIAPATYPSVSTSYSRYIGDNSGVNQFYGYMAQVNPFGASPQTIERAKRWIWGSSTQYRTITKIIPFADLFPRFPDSLITNIRQIRIEIIWNSTTDLLDHFALGAPSTTDAAVSVFSCDILSDTYIPQAQQFNASVDEKLKGESDKCAFLSTQVFNLTYNPGTDLIIPGLSNFDSCVVMQTARGLSNGQLTTAIRTYNSNGQTLIFGNSATATANTIKLRADDPTPTDSLPITSAQIQFAGRLYPSSTIQTVQTSNVTQCFDPTQLYLEYRKFCGKLARRDLSAAVPMWAFKGSFPFIAIRPWSDNGFHLSSGGDLILRMQGGTAGPVQIVVFRVVIAEISSDGVVSIHK